MLNAHAVKLEDARDANWGPDVCQENETTTPDYKSEKPTASFGGLLLLTNF